MTTRTVSCLDESNDSDIRIVKKRNTNPLLPNSIDLRYAIDTADVIPHCCLDPRYGLRNDGSYHKSMKNRVKRFAGKKTKQKVISNMKVLAFSNKRKINTNKISSTKLLPGMSLNRRTSIHYIFGQLYHYPNEAEWKELDLINMLMCVLGIEHNSRKALIKVLRDILSKKMKGVIYNPNENLKNRGRKPLIKELDNCAQVIYNALGSGLSIANAAIMVNKVRRNLDPPLPPVSWSTVKRFVRNSTVIFSHRRQTKKSGATDAESLWAKARLAQVKQFLKQLKKTKYNLKSNDKTPRRLELHGIV